MIKTLVFIGFIGLVVVGYGVPYWVREIRKGSAPFQETAEARKRLEESARK